MGQKSVFVVLMGIFALAVFSVVVFAAHEITPGSFTVDEDVSYRYNVTVNNTDALTSANITEVNIAIPSTFTFVLSTNATTATTSAFTNTSTVLSWTNAGLVSNLTKRSFWFNATASTPGTYGLIVTTTNTTASYTSNVTVTINDLGNPTAAAGTNPTDGTNTTNAEITFDLSCTDSVGIGTLQLWTNVSGSWAVNQTNVSAINGTFWNVSATGIPEGYYLWGVFCNDSSGNADWSNTNRTLLVDRTEPSVAFSCSSASVSLDGSLSCSCSGSDTLSGVQTVVYTASPSTASTGTFSTICTVRDYAQNNASSSVTYTVNSGGGGMSTTTQQKIQTRNVWEKINPGEVVLMQSFDARLPLETIAFDVTDLAEHVVVTATYNYPEDVSIEKEHAYSYFSLETESLLSHLNEANLTLRVAKSWVSDQSSFMYEDLSLFRLNEETLQWEKLPTTLVREDDDTYFYRVTLTSFSSFVVALSSGDAAETTGDTATNEEEQSETTSAQPSSSSSDVWTWIIVLVVIALVLFLLYAFRDQIVSFFEKLQRRKR